MKKKIPAVFAVLLALTLTISQVVCAFAETAAQTDAIAFADGTYTGRYRSADVLYRVR